MRNSCRRPAAAFCRSVPRLPLRCVSRLTAAGLVLVFAFAGPVPAAGSPEAVAASLQELSGLIAAGLKTPGRSAQELAVPDTPPVVEADVAPAPLVVTDDISTSRDTVGFGPAQTHFVPAAAYSVIHPDAAPSGANDFGCKPSPGQRPVVMVHGTFTNAYEGFAMISPELKDAGYCPFTFEYGILDVGVPRLIPGAYGVGDIARSAEQLAAFIDRVLTATGASAVDVIGYSQGGPMARQYLKFDGGAAKVAKLITLAGSNHGTTVDGIAELGRAINNFGIDVLGSAQLALGPAATQQVVGSDFLETLDADGDTVPDVDYTIIGTNYDEVVTPPQSTFLTAGPDATVANVTLQDGCPVDHSGHLSIPYSPRAVSLIKHALDPTAAPVCAAN